jgi:hypothetical protein
MSWWLPGARRYLVVTGGSARYHSGCMIKALLLIFNPVGTWDRIARAQRGFAFVFGVFFLPLLALTSFAEGYGLVRWGKLQQNVEYLKRFTPTEATTFEIIQVILWLTVVLVGAWTVKMLGETFHGRHSFTQTFTTVAYGLSPLLLFRVFDAFPSVNPWIPWIVGILLVMRLLYQGVPRMMQPDPPHAFGLYLMSTFLLVMTSGLARFVSAWYLEGRFKSLEKIISDLAARFTP